MKQFVKVLSHLTIAFAFAFTAQILIFTLIGLLTGQNPLLYTIVIQSAGIAAITVLLQALFFTDIFIKRMAYALRIALFALVLYAVLAGSAMLFGWFLIELGYLISFTLIFLVILALMTFAFHIYFRISGNRYDQSLNAYRSRLEGQEKENPDHQA